MGSWRSPLYFPLIIPFLFSKVLSHLLVFYMEIVPYICSILLLYSGHFFLLYLFLGGSRSEPHTVFRMWTYIQQIYRSGVWLCLLLPRVSFLLILNNRCSLLINAGFVRPHLLHEWLQSPLDTILLYVNLGLVFLHNFTVTYTEFHMLFYCERIL